MSRQVPWEPSALNTATGHLKTDPDSLQDLLTATDRLAEEPRPAGSRPWGIDYRRLHLGRWRILYRIDTDARTLHIEHIRRTDM
ncbi:type II toxin-antitoxin system RelE/ParE family toxin [Streptomyces sp. MZ04]|uniref:type II toxin-antitoxin system RelE family toxin n=1 Tax=Streptomyces sp. MZ04 TaxID=2559236 RepID=UPI00107EE619|nr:type II toxin-antitoxin system RelE/ParE family toxin [Streptomyces sp. MZ04]TGB13519.1 type II toxin-antitoxin system RelE/ParE family toxin [Streptomyces sp. MZ04]